MERRAFVVAAVSAAVGVTAGCSNTPERQPTTSTAEEGTPTRTTSETATASSSVPPEDWGGLEILNLGSEQRDVVVELSRDGETVYRNQLSLSGEGHEGMRNVVEHEGEYRVAVSVVDGPSTATTVEFDETSHLLSISVDSEEITVRMLAA